MKRCAQCHGKLGLGVRSRNVWNGRWWVHVLYCSTHCKALQAGARCRSARISALKWPQLCSTTERIFHGSGGVTMRAIRRVILILFGAILIAASTPTFAQQPDASKFNQNYQSELTKARQACAAMWNDHAFDPLGNKLSLGEQKLVDRSSSAPDCNQGRFPCKVG
jgi:hypothetical protein